MRAVAANLLICLLLASSVFLSAPVSAEEGDRLNQISSKLESLKASQSKLEKDMLLNQEEAKKNSLELTRFEKEIAALSQLSQEQTVKTAKLAEEIADTTDRVFELQNQSSKRLKAFYVSSVGGGVINTAVENDYSAASRNIFYLKKLREHEIRISDELKRLSDNLAQQKQDLATSQSETARATEGLIKARQQVSDGLAKQTKLLADLKRKKTENSKLITQLRAESLRIETAIASLSQEASSLPAEDDSKPALSKLEDSASSAQTKAAVQPAEFGNLFADKLPAPATGVVVMRFGAKTIDSYGQQSLSKGLGYLVPEGSAIKAIGAGNVVFAGILGDYGQVVIVDHGNRIHSLYSMLETIDVKAGQQLIAADTIGKVGRVMSPKSYNLYFELRVAGQAQNPELRMK